jgi:hypothetical protein
LTRQEISVSIAKDNQGRRVLRGNAAGWKSEQYFAFRPRRHIEAELGLTSMAGYSDLAMSSIVAAATDETID